MNIERKSHKKLETTRNTEESNPKSSKRRSKQRTKVWEKVAWFTRKTKQGKDSKSSCSTVVSKKENTDPFLCEIRGVECDKFASDDRELNCSNTRYVSKTKPKNSLSKAASFTYLRRRKLKHLDKDINSVFVEERACQTATGTFHDFVSERRTSRLQVIDKVSKLSFTKGVNPNQVSQSCCSFSTETFISSLERSRSFSVPGYKSNSWPRKKRTLLQRQNELWSPPLKQQKTSGLRKTATFSGFEASKINVSDLHSMASSQHLAKSTPLLTGNKPSQIRNQNGISVGVIHFFKSPRKDSVDDTEPSRQRSSFYSQKKTGIMSADEMENVDLCSDLDDCNEGSSSAQELKESESANTLAYYADTRAVNKSNYKSSSLDNIDKDIMLKRSGLLYQRSKLTTLDAKHFAMGSSLGAVATMKECFVVEDEVDCQGVSSESIQAISSGINDHDSREESIDILLNNMAIQSNIASKLSSNLFTGSLLERKKSNSSLDVIREIPDSVCDYEDLEQSLKDNAKTVATSEYSTSKNQSVTSAQLPASYQPLVSLELVNSETGPKSVTELKIQPTEVKCIHQEPCHDLLSKRGKMINLNKPKVDGQVFKERTEIFLEWFKEFNDEQKNIIIRKMMESCQLPQMHLLSVLMEPVLHKACPPNCQDMLAWLPHNVTSIVMSYLGPVSLCRCGRVSRLWNRLSSNFALWKKLCSNDEWQMSRIGERKQFERNTLPNGSVQWKKMFAERYLLRQNWLNGRCKVRTFEGHTQGISCVQFDDTRIVSGSSDKTIKVWDLRRDDASAVLTLAGHSGTVRCLNLNANRLVSGSVDRSIKVWDLSFESYWSGASCKVTMVGHVHTVRCIQVDDEKVVSGSYDKTLKVWDIKTGQCKLTLRGHNAAVLCVQFDDSKIVSGSYDNTIKVWSLTEGSCLMTLTGHHDAVTCLNLTTDGRKVISGSLDHNLKFWDLATGKCIGTLDWIRSEGHTGVVRCLQSDSWRIVSAGDDKTLKMWSLESGQRLLTLRCHTDGVTCLQFNDYRIVSGSYDKTVKVWDFTPAHEFLDPG